MRPEPGELPVRVAASPSSRDPSGRLPPGTHENTGLPEPASIAAAVARSVEADIRNIVSGDVHPRRFAAAWSEASGVSPGHRTSAPCVQIRGKRPGSTATWVLGENVDLETLGRQMPPR